MFQRTLFLSPQGIRINIAKFLSSPRRNTIYCIYNYKTPEPLTILVPLQVLTSLKEMKLSLPPALGVISVAKRQWKPK